MSTDSRPADAPASVHDAGVFPALFVLLWSTGFIAAKYGLPYAPPYAFLALRFVLVAALMSVVALATRAAWPRTVKEYRDLAFVAILVHALYLGGVFLSLDSGMAAATSAMLVGLQPILTVVIAWRWMHEHVSARQWSGLVLGLAGVYSSIRHKVDFGGDLRGLVPSAVALVGISIGTLYQKKHCAHVDLRSGAVVQFAVCALLFVPLALLADARPVQWTGSSCSRSAGRCSCCRSGRLPSCTGSCATARPPTSRACSTSCRPSRRSRHTLFGETLDAWRWPAWCSSPLA